MIDLGTVTHERFDACRGQRFLAADAGPEAVELVLAEVRPRTASDPPRSGRQAFALTFTGPAAPVLEQRMYTLRNETLGELTIFLVPVGVDGERMLYEAVFT